MRLDGERLAGVDTVHELFKIDTAQGIPVAVQVGITDIFGKQFKLLDVVRVAIHQVLVVTDRGSDEDIVVGVFAVLELPVNEEPLHPSVADTAGVTGQVHPLREIVRASDDSRKATELSFQKLGGFFHEYHIVLLTLIAAHDCRAVSRHIAELDDRAVNEGDAVLGLVVAVDVRRQDSEDGVDDAVLHVGVFPADHKDLDAGVIHREEYGLSLGGPALAATSRTAVADVLRRAGEIFPLRVTVRLAKVDADLLCILVLALIRHHYLQKQKEPDPTPAKVSAQALSSGLV